MKLKSTLHMMPPSEHREGECAVCELLVLLKFQDAAGTVKMGECCLRFMVNAERFLSAVGRPMLVAEMASWRKWRGLKK